MGPEKKKYYNQNYNVLFLNWKSYVYSFSNLSCLLYWTLSLFLFLFIFLLRGQGMIACFFLTTDWKIDQGFPFVLQNGVDFWGVENSSNPLHNTLITVLITNYSLREPLFQPFHCNLICVAKTLCLNIFWCNCKRNSHVVQLRDTTDSTLVLESWSMEHVMSQYLDHLLRLVSQTCLAKDNHSII